MLMRMFISLYKYTFMFIYLSDFPNWYLVTRRQTFGRETQVYSYKRHISVDKMTTPVTTFVYKVH